MHHQTNSHWICLIKRQLFPKAEALALFPGEVGGKLPKPFTAVQDYHLSGPVYQTV